MTMRKHVKDSEYFPQHKTIVFGQLFVTLEKGMEVYLTLYPNVKFTEELDDEDAIAFAEEAGSRVYYPVDPVSHHTLPVKPLFELTWLLAGFLDSMEMETI